MDAQCKSRELAISCPYWLLNKTDVPLQCKDSMPQAAAPQACFALAHFPSCLAALRFACKLMAGSAAH